MEHEDALTDELDAREHERRSAASAYLTPEVCAISAFTLAVVALFGQNAVSIGVGSLLESRTGPAGNAFHVGWALAVCLQVGLVLLLARRSAARPDGWPALLGRAAVVLSFVALAAGALVLLGGLLHG